MIDELLAYQEADGKLRAIEQKISATEERKKYSAARKFLEKAPEKLDALDARAAELKHMFARLQKKSEELAETIKEYENLGEMIGQQGGEIAFFYPCVDGFFANAEVGGYFIYRKPTGI